MIRGARQVGKTWLVREFSKSFESFLEINFDEQQDKHSLFKSGEVTDIIRLLQVDWGKSIIPGKTLLFLDEIQAAPEVIRLLRYFYEKVPGLHVIAAGSLLEFVLKDEVESMPVGRIEFMFIGPLTFEEFLLAQGENYLVDYLAAWIPGQEIPETLHKKCLAQLRSFMAVGGMPEPVARFCEAGDFAAAARIQAGILETLQADFSKYGMKIDSRLLRLVFRRAPQIVGAKVKYVNITPDESAGRLHQALQALADARLITIVYHSDGGLPLNACCNMRRFKILYLDIGLFTQALSPGAGNGILLAENLLTANCGAAAEQLVGQHLLYPAESWSTPGLHYWHSEQVSASAEVDYLLQFELAVVPVEVKAGKTGSLRSLQVFCFKKRCGLALRFNTDYPSLGEVRHTIPALGEVSYRLLSLPIYMVGQSRRLLGASLLSHLD